MVIFSRKKKKNYSLGKHFDGTVFELVALRLPVAEFVRLVYYVQRKNVQLLVVRLLHATVFVQRHDL